MAGEKLNARECLILDKSTLKGGSKSTSESENKILSLQHHNVAPGSSRDAWLEEAKRRRGEQHDSDLEEGDIEDPLGCAVRQTLGLGVSLAYDYSDPPGIIDSLPQLVHILRARCILSAVKRVRYLYDPERARNEIEGGKSREELRAEVENEVERLRQAVDSLSVFSLEPPDTQRGIDLKQVRGLEGPESYRLEQPSTLFSYQPQPKNLEDIIDEIREEEYGVEFEKSEETKKVFNLLRATRNVPNEPEDQVEAEEKFLNELIKERYGGDDDDSIIFSA